MLVKLFCFDEVIAEVYIPNARTVLDCLDSRLLRDAVKAYDEQDITHWQFEVDYDFTKGGE